MDSSPKEPSKAVLRARILLLLLIVVFDASMEKIHNLVKETLRAVSKSASGEIEPMKRREDEPFEE